MVASVALRVGLGATHRRSVQRRARGYESNRKTCRSRRHSTPTNRGYEDLSFERHLTSANRAGEG
jgi:hypothetical protein